MIGGYRQDGPVFAFAIVVLVSASILFTSRIKWLGSNLYSLDSTLSTLTIAGPALALVVCLAVQRVRKMEAVSSSYYSRARWLPLVVALQVWIVGVAAFCLVVCLVVFANMTGLHGGPLPLTDCVVAGVVYLLFAASVGFLLAVVSDAIVMVPVSFGAVFLIGLFGAMGILPDMFRVGGATADLSGLTWDTGYLLFVAVFQVAIAILFILAGQSIVHSKVGWTRPFVALRGFSVVALAAILIAGVAHQGWAGKDGQRFVRSTERANACTVAKPRICVAPAMSRHIADISEVATPLQEKLSRSGLAAPVAYNQLLPMRGHSLESGFIWLDTWEDGTLDLSRDTVAAWLASPAQCAAWFGNTDPQGLEADRDRVIRWLLSKTDRPSPQVANAFHNLRTCDGVEK